MKQLTAGMLLALSLGCTFPAAYAAEEAAAQPAAVTTAETEAQPQTETEAPAPSAVLKKSGSKYYLYNSATGKKVSGRTGVKEFPSGSGNYYYFVNAKGRVYANRKFTKNNKTYYADKDGVLATGFTTIGKNTYYFKTKTHTALKGGWKKIFGTHYYFLKNGVQLTGLQKIGKYTYYLNPAKNGAKSIGWTKVNKKWQYFNERGRRQYGLVTDPDTKNTYFTDADGNRKTGLITYQGSRYYFDKTAGYTSTGRKIGGAMITGWKTIKNKTYYFSKTGKAVTGILKLNGKTYYFNANGVMQTGKITLGTTVYTFDSKTGAMTNKADISGPYSIKVNQGTCVVTIYRGTTPVKAMLCSVGLNGATPNGTFTLDRKIHWQALFGNCYGQYTSRITGNILFHSVYYYNYKDDNSLATNEYNKLGQPASHGCVRLNCADAYYIYANCPNGTKVTIFQGTAADDPLPRPAKLWINTSYDPTDPIKGD